MIKYTDKKIIDVNDWDKLVKKTYGKPYSFQQQEGCQDRGIVNLTISIEDYNDEEMEDSILEKVNGEEMGVKFTAWLARDPKQSLSSGKNEEWEIEMFWRRNFYPNINMVANDLCKKGW